MKNIKTNKKILSALAVLAVSASAVYSAAAFAGCTMLDLSGKREKADGNAEVSKISTAVGEINSKSSGTTYYVAVDGSEKNDGLTAEKPKDIVSLLNSQEILQAGDTVLVAPGTYKLSQNSNNEHITMLVSGEYNKYITVKNSDITKPCVIDFSDQSFLSTNRGVSLYGSYIYWYGIDVCGAGDNGLYIGGSYNTVEYCEFYNNRDTGLQLGRSYSEYAVIDTWPSYNLVKNCTSHNNYDNETYGENADGFAAKLTVGYGNVFDGCIAYRNSDDGWDLYAKTESGNIGTVIMYNCVAYENGFIEYTQAENNARFKTFNSSYAEDNTNSYLTRDGDGNGFKLGGSTMEGDVLMYNCLSFNNRMHGVTDNSNPGVLSIKGVTSYNNGAGIDNDKDSPHFGYVRDVINGDNHANIDLSRQTYSYNNISRVLSVGDKYNNYSGSASNLSSDELRGSSVDSVLVKVSGVTYSHYALGGAYDVQSKVSGSGIADYGTGITVDSEALFEKLPYTFDGTDYTFNITGYRDLYENQATSGGLNANRAHIVYRNNDGSVNMHDILAKKAGVDENLISGQNIGSTVNKTSYADYEHFYAADFADGAASSRDAATVKRAAETLKLTLTCDPDAVYQDFDLVNRLTGYRNANGTLVDVSIKWETSDSSVLAIDDSRTQISVSKSEYIKAVVYRDPVQDKTVTLTAKLVCGSAGETVQFNLTVKRGVPKLGNIFVTTQSGDVISNGGSYIVDQYAIFREPVVSVENGIDYNGKIIPKDQYTISSSYVYKSAKNGKGVTVQGFTPSKAGVYTITHSVKLNGSEEIKSMIYTVYVVSPYSEVEFNGNASVTVNRYGYILSGEVTNATGSIYAVSSSVKLNDITADNIKTYQGVKSYSFRADSISFQFENANSGEYYIYYALTNAAGQVTTEVYEAKVSVKNIGSETAFMEMVNSESSPSTIYLLTKDLDFSSKTWKTEEQTFKGLFNGAGHTITGITSENKGSTSKDSAYVFYKVGGGTIMNVKFIDTNIKANNGEKNGLVSESNGGYFYNIQLIGLNVYSSAQRVGGLIGHVSPGTVVSIDQVAVDNGDSKYENYKIASNNQRAGGLIGFSQSSGGGSITIEIKNSYVNACVEAPYEVGGFYGTFDCGNSQLCKYYLTMSKCVFTGKVVSTGSKSYAGGILGYQKGNLSNMSITDCVSVGEVWFQGERLAVSLKNASMIVGCSTTPAEGIQVSVKNCFANMEEYSTSYDVAVWGRYDLIDVNSYTEKAGLDTGKWEFIYKKDSTSTLVAPYVSLKFLGA